MSTVAHRAVRGAAALTIATYVSILFGIGARKVLAVYLSPEQVGIYQAALSFVNLVISFASFSFTSAIINVRENLVEEPLENLRENVFILTISVNAVFTVLAMGLGLFSLSKQHGVIIAAIVGVYSVQRFMSALDTFYTQILERELSYSKISRVTVASNFVLHGASVALALSGVGAWTVPVATLLSTILSFSLDQYYVHRSGLHAAKSHPFRYYNAKTARWLWRFGTKVLFNRLFEAWLFRIDNVMVVYLFGSLYLGYYSQAFTIAQLPAMAVAPVVARVAIATYAELQHDRRRLEEAFAMTNYFLVRLLVPATLFMFVCSKDLVRVFLSSNWGYSVAPLMALGGFVLTVPLFENAKMVLGSKLMLKEISFIRGGQLVLLVVLLFLFGDRGIVWVAGFVSAVSLLGYGAVLFLLRTHVTLQLRAIFGVPLMIGAGLALLIYFVIEPLVMLPLEPGFDVGTSVTRLAIYGAGILASSFAIEYMIHPSLMRARIESVRSRLKR